MFHQSVSALLIVIDIFRSLYAREKSLRPSRLAQEQDISSKEQRRRDLRDEQILRITLSMIPFGLLFLASTFLPWNLDNILLQPSPLLASRNCVFLGCRT